MSDLHQIIYFCTFFDSCGFKYGSIYCCAGSYFHIIFKYDISVMVNFYVSAVFCVSISETVASYNAICKQMTAISYFCVIIDYNIRMNDTFFADLHIVAYKCSCHYNCIFTYFYIASYINIWHYCRILRYLRRFFFSNQRFFVISA